jgi:hypothetical protein
VDKAEEMKTSADVITLLADETIKAWQESVNALRGHVRAPAPTRTVMQSWHPDLNPRAYEEYTQYTQGSWQAESTPIEAQRWGTPVTGATSTFPHWESTMRSIRGAGRI